MTKLIVPGEARFVEGLSAITSRAPRFNPVTWLVVGRRRDQYAHWRVSDTASEALHLHEAAGDPSSGRSPRTYRSFMAVRAYREEVVRLAEEEGGRQEVVFDVGGVALGGEFDMTTVEDDRTPPEFVDIALGVGQEALLGGLAVRRPDNTLAPIETIRLDSHIAGVPGVSYKRLRAEFPTATLL